MQTWAPRRLKGLLQGRCGCECSLWRSCAGKLTPNTCDSEDGLNLLLSRLCSDAELMRGVWDRYDAEESGSSVFTSLVSTLNRLIAEKPALLGVSQQMFGVGALASAVGEGPGTGGGYGLDVGGVAGMVATAATSTMSGVVGMIASGPGLSTQKSAMKLQW